MSRKTGRLFIISAPSGAGKGTVIAKMLELRPGLVMSVSATTRQPRAGEIDGEAYHFMEVDQFKEMISRGDFLEYAEYAGDFYGTPKEPVISSIEDGKDVLLEIEVKGARQVLSLIHDAVSIFIVPPDMDELERRLRGRGTDTEEKLAKRLRIAISELRHKNEYMHIVVNDEVERAAEEILSIIDSSN